MENILRQNAIYPEKKLVDLYGSEAIKKSYHEKGHFIGNQKNTFLKNISKYCEVKELKNRRYRIKNIYEFAIPLNFNRMNKSLYKYSVPLLLNLIINKNDDTNIINMTLPKWARSIGIVNGNYNLARYNKPDTSKLIDQDESVVVEFFDKLNEMITWYMLNSFNYLKDAGLIEWYEVSHVVKEVTIKTLEIDEYGNINPNIKLDSHRSSKEEKEYYSKCVDIADKAANIEDKRERYFSNKTLMFTKVLNEELYKRNIKRVYDTYEIHCVNFDYCKFVLKLFGEFNKKEFISNQNKELCNMVIKNARKRFENNPSKYKRYSNEEYIICFEQLCNIVIDNDTENLKNRIKEKTIKDEYTLCFTEDDIKK